MSARTCEAVHAHHPDCACPICEACADNVCNKPADALIYDRVDSDGAPVGGFPACETCAADFARDRVHLVAWTSS